MDGGALSRWEAEATMAIYRNDQNSYRSMNKKELARREREENKKQRLESEYDDPQNW